MKTKRIEKVRIEVDPISGEPVKKKERIYFWIAFAAFMITVLGFAMF
jgi:hypothetical protein